MNIKCDYCGGMVDETNQTCPNCGAPLNGVNRMASGEPKTIEELQQWYTAHHLPPEQVTRFFIGKDIKEPRAFGIYRDSAGDFIVYKNKSNGERAVRYRGKDEAYAVNELYQKLKTEIANQKSRNNAVSGNQAQRRSPGNQPKKKSNGKVFLIIILIYVAIGALVSFFDHSPSRGYYRYNGNDYYYQSSSWYYYDDTLDDWYPASSSSIPDDLANDENGEYRVYNHEGEDFEDSQWYREPSSDSDDDWDSGSDWSSSDDWDSGSTDWDSDW